MYKLGQTLLTKDGRKFGNGIIAHVLHHAVTKRVHFFIVTDFGNMLIWDEDQIMNQYYLGEITDCDRWFKDRREDKLLIIPSYFAVME